MFRKKQRGDNSYMHLGSHAEFPTKKGSGRQPHPYVGAHASPYSAWRCPASIVQKYGSTQAAMQLGGHGVQFAADKEDIRLTFPCLAAECAEREPLVAHLARVPKTRALSLGDALAFEKSLHR